MSIAIGIVGRHRTVRLAGSDRPDPALLASTPLRLTVDRPFDHAAAEVWSDDADGALETKVAAIVAGVVVAA